VPLVERTQTFIYSVLALKHFYEKKYKEQKNSFCSKVPAKFNLKNKRKDLTVAWEFSPFFLKSKQTQQR